jgi:hypothetical protein
MKANRKDIIHRQDAKTPRTANTTKQIILFGLRLKSKNQSFLSHLASLRLGGEIALSLGVCQ